MLRKLFVQITSFVTACITVCLLVQTQVCTTKRSHNSFLLLAVLTPAGDAHNQAVLIDACC
jgi:hypothetical protein